MADIISESDAIDRLRTAAVQLAEKATSAGPASSIEALTNGARNLAEAAAWLYNPAQSH